MVIMYYKRAESILFLLLIFSLLLACSPTQRDDLTIPAINGATNTPQGHALSTSAIETIRPTFTLRPSPEPKCPGLNTSLTIHETETGEEAEQVIFNYLNEGGSPEQLQNQIANLGPIVNSYQAINIDINMDGVQEVVIAINFAPPISGNYEQMYSKLSVYSCLNDGYQVENITGEGMTTIKIVAMENLLAPEQPEILVIRGYFNFNWCYEFVEIYSLKVHGWFSSSTTEEFLCGINAKLKSNDAGEKELVVEGQRGCSYLACVPSRGRRLIYRFLGDKVELTTDELLPSSYRIHVLEDGEIAIEKGDLETAIGIYNTAAEDNNLINLLTELEKELQISRNLSDVKIRKIAHDYQTSFAFFRELTLLLYLRRSDGALQVLEQIKVRYPEGNDGSEFIDISNYLFEQIKNGLTVKESCELTNEYLANKYILGSNNFVYLHLNGWGDMSPQIGEILCPVVEQQ